MDANKRKRTQRHRRHRRVRKKILGSAERPRLCVFKSAKHIYAQIIDDSEGRTIVAASTQKLGEVKADEKTGRKTAAAREVGRKLAEAARERGIARVAFDRGGYQYHGRVAALADGARKAGLEF